MQNTGHAQVGSASASGSSRTLETGCVNYLSLVGLDEMREGWVQSEWSGIQGPDPASSVPLPCLGKRWVHPTGMQLQGPPSYWAAALSRWVLISYFWKCHYSLSESCSHASWFLHWVLIRNRSRWCCHRTTTYSPQEAREPETHPHGQISANKEVREEESVIKR